MHWVWTTERQRKGKKKCHWLFNSNNFSGLFIFHLKAWWWLSFVLQFLFASVVLILLFNEQALIFIPPGEFHHFFFSMQTCDLFEDNAYELNSVKRSFVYYQTKYCDKKNNQGNLIFETTNTHIKNTHTHTHTHTKTHTQTEFTQCNLFEFLKTLKMRFFYDADLSGVRDVCAGH